MEIHRLQGLLAYSHLIETDEALFLVDTGFRGHGRTVLRAIRALGRDPQELRLVIVTHGHPDHVGGLARIQAATGCDVACHPNHAEAIAAGRPLVSPGLNPGSRIYEFIARQTIRNMRKDAIQHVVPLMNGAALHSWGLPGRILHTPGHSDGCISVLLEDGSAFVGDLVQGRRIPSLTPVERPTMAMEPAQVLDGWRLLIESGAQRVYPGHGSVVSTRELAKRLATLRRLQPIEELPSAG